jgi:cytochrome P450
VVLPTNETTWLITRYDDAALVLKDERFSKNRSNALTPEQLAKQVWFRKLSKLKWLNPLQLMTVLHRHTQHLRDDRRRHGQGVNP